MSRNPKTENETLYLQDRDETETFQKTSRDCLETEMLETEMFRTDTTSLVNTNFALQVEFTERK